MPDPWTQRCPKGHAALENVVNGYACASCRRAGDDYRYEGEPFDARKHEFPVDDYRVETREIVDRDRVLRIMVARADKVTWTAVGHIEHLGTRQEIGAQLRELRKDGLVKKREQSHRPLWRPTADGFAVVEKGGIEVPP